MGGFGAMSYAARHPRLFRAAASFSGAVDTRYPDPAAPFLRTLDILGLGAWGDPVTNADVWREHNPTDRADRLRGVALFVTTGDGTMGGPLGDLPIPLAYATEAVVGAMSRSFVRALDAAGVPHTDDFYGPGYHGWPYWQRALHWLLPAADDDRRTAGIAGTDRIFERPRRLNRAAVRRRQRRVWT
jgi:S-formylglutathione hydrolase FrmB